MALAQGAVGERWLAELDGTVAAAVDRWGLVLGEVLEGGTASWVAAARLPDGTSAVLKAALPLGPHGQLAHEARVLELAGGRGCARLLALDLDHGLLLMERLGGQLHDQGLAEDEQLVAMCGPLRALWSVPAHDAGLPTLEEKAGYLDDLATTLWERLGHPCPEPVVGWARTCVERRRRQLDPERFVLAHGDAHPWNTLVDPGGGYRLVDPDGLLAEPEYDLAIPMRELTDELLAGDPLTLGRARARRLAELTGTEAHRIWEWGCVERTTTGLLCLEEGLEEEGRALLRVAEAWMGADLA